MQASLESASASQLRLVSGHGESVAKHFRDETETVKAESAALIGNINSYVQRMVNEFKTGLLRRGDGAAATFATEGQSIAHAIQAHKTEQTKQGARIGAENAEFLAASRAALDVARRGVATAHKTATANLASVVKRSRASDAAVGKGVAAVEQLSAAHHQATAAACESEELIAGDTRKATVAKLSAMDREHAEASEGFAAAFDSQAEQFGAGAGLLKAALDSTLAEVSGTVEHADDDLVDTEASGVTFVSNTLQRDSALNPTPVQYTYPVECVPRRAPAKHRACPLTRPPPGTPRRRRTTRSAMDPTASGAGSTRSARARCCRESPPISPESWAPPTRVGFTPALPTSRLAQPPRKPWPLARGSATARSTRRSPRLLLMTLPTSRPRPSSAFTVQGTPRFGGPPLGAAKAPRTATAEKVSPLSAGC